MFLSFISRIFRFNRNSSISPIEEMPTQKQFILSFSTNEEPTSNVSKEKIREALNHLAQYGEVWLSVSINIPTSYGDCSGMSCKHTDNSNPQMAVYFPNSEGVTRYINVNYDIDTICTVFCNFLEKYEIPDISRWKQDELTRCEPSREPFYLYTDDGEFHNIEYNDVIATLENIEAGISTSLLLRTPSGQTGYMEVKGAKNDYTVEIGGYNRHGIWVTYYTRTCYSGSVRHWLSNYFHQKQFPRITDEWIDITEESSQR